MEFEYQNFGESNAAQESEIARLKDDLDRAEFLLYVHGLSFERTPNPAMPWYRPGIESNPHLVRLREDAMSADNGESIDVTDMTTGEFLAALGVPDDRIKEMLDDRGELINDQGDVGC